MTWADTAPWLIRLTELPSKPVALLEQFDEMRGPYCPFAQRMDLMSQARAVPAPDAMHPRGLRYTKLTIGVDGTNRGNRGHVHCAMAGPWSRPNYLAS